MTRDEVLNRAWDIGAGGMTPLELAKLYNLCRGLDVLEIGSMIGQSSFVIAHAARSLTCVDAWIDGCPFLEPEQSQHYKIENMEQAFDRNMAGLKFRKIKAFSYQASGLLRGEQFDAILIDADHSRDAVYSDITAALPLLRPAGLLLLHDYNSRAWPGVREAADILLPEYTPEVIHALGVFRT